MSIYKQNLHLPYTCLVTKLRMSKRQSQNQMADILKQIINVKNNCEQKTKQQVLEALKQSKQKLESLKDRLNIQKQQQDQIYNTCRKRVHLDQELIERKKLMTKQQIIYEFDKQVVQFFACRNKINEAREIKNSLNENYYFELYVQLYQKAFHISQSIIKNDLRPLKDWCYEHSHYLTKMKSSLQFKLISCGFVNILNNKNAVKAIQFLRKEVATLTLSQKDKEEVNRLTFMVLKAENQFQFQYYSDSQIQKQRQAKEKQIQQKKLMEKSIKNERNQEKQQKQQKKQQKKVQNSSSSSSSNIVVSLVETQEKMGQIYKVFGELAEGAQNLISRVLGTNEQIEQNIYQNKLQNLEPLDIPISLPEQQEIEQQIYQQKFDSLSEQEQEKNKQKQQKFQKQKKNSQIKHKKLQRKHQLDKNQLRNLLHATKKQFIKAFSKIYHLSFHSYFDKTLAIGISLLKTSSCSQIHVAQKQRGRCPICTPQIQRLIKKIPGILQNESSLICRLNGSLMNQANYPVALPNGQIYSIEGLSKHQKNGKYYCPVQNKWFRKQMCRKVFLS